MKTCNLNKNKNTNLLNILKYKKYYCIIYIIVVKDSMCILISKTIIQNHTILIKNHKIQYSKLVKEINIDSRLTLPKIKIHMYRKTAKDMPSSVFN